jgi:dihydropteroate synthase
MVAFNLSPESFYAGSVIRSDNRFSLEQQMQVFAAEGAEIFDFGPKSSAPFDLYGRPTQISPQEEIERLKLVFDIYQELSLSSHSLVSVDTQNNVVAEYALKREADIINDISGLQQDPDLAKIIADYDAGVILMAAKSQPGDVYKIPEVIDVLQHSSNQAIKAGIKKEKIIIDPGIGGWIPERTHDDDFQLIAKLPYIKTKLKFPTLIALSRKSFIGKILKLPAQERLFGSLGATTVAVLQGADIIRTHDIRETRDTVKIAEQFRLLM